MMNLFGLNGSVIPQEISAIFNVRFRWRKKNHLTKKSSCRLNLKKKIGAEIEWIHEKFNFFEKPKESDLIYVQ